MFVCSGMGTCLTAFSMKMMNHPGGAEGCALTRKDFYSLSPVAVPWDEETIAESLHWRGEGILHIALTWVLTKSSRDALNMCSVPKVRTVVGNT